MDTGDINVLLFHMMVVLEWDHPITERTSIIDTLEAGRNAAEPPGIVTEDPPSII